MQNGLWLWITKIAFSREPANFRSKCFHGCKVDMSGYRLVPRSHWKKLKEISGAPSKLKFWNFGQLFFTFSYVFEICFHILEKQILPWKTRLKDLSIDIYMSEKILINRRENNAEKWPFKVEKLNFLNKSFIFKTKYLTNAREKKFYIWGHSYWRCLDEI